MIKGRLFNLISDWMKAEWSSKFHSHLRKKFNNKQKFCSGLPTHLLLGPLRPIKSTPTCCLTTKPFHELQLETSCTVRDHSSSSCGIPNSLEPSVDVHTTSTQGDGIGRPVCTNNLLLLIVRQLSTIELDVRGKAFEALDEIHSCRQILTLHLREQETCYDNDWNHKAVHSNWTLHLHCLAADEFKQIVYHPYWLWAIFVQNENNSVTYQIVTCCVPTNKKHLRSLLPVNQVELSLNTNSFQKPKKKVVTWSLPLLSKITRVERTSTYSFLSFLHSFLPSTSFTLHLLCAVDSASTPQ